MPFYKAPKSSFLQKLPDSSKHVVKKNVYLNFMYILI